MISVIIPAYNEEKLIADCLNGLVLQQTDKKFEVILVDNNSTDKTRLIAEKYKDKMDLKIITETKKGRGAARAAGFKKAKGNIFFSTDADTIVPPNWIDKFCEALEKSSAVALTGTLKVEDVTGFKKTLINNLSEPYMTSYRAIFKHYWLSGFSFAIYKAIYEKSGGFNPELTSQEDTDLAFRVSKLGKIKLIKDTPVIFSARRFKNGLVSGFLPYALTFATLFFQKKSSELPDVR